MAVVVAKNATTAADGKVYQADYDDFVISVGYRVNSKRGTQFRTRPTRVLKEHFSRWENKGNDGGQFFTPRQVMRAMVRAVDPRPGQTMYDPCCGAVGFLIESFKHMRTSAGADATADQVESLRRRSPDSLRA